MSLACFKKTCTLFSTSFEAREKEKICMNANNK